MFTKRWILSLHKYRTNKNGSKVFMAIAVTMMALAVVDIKMAL